MTEHPLDVRQAAAYVGLGTTAFEAIVREGSIPHGRDGRRRIFTRTELDEWLESHRRLRPVDLSHLSDPLKGGDRYLRGGSAAARVSSAR